MSVRGIGILLMTRTCPLLLWVLGTKCRVTVNLRLLWARALRTIARPGLLLWAPKTDRLFTVLSGPMIVLLMACMKLVRLVTLCDMWAVGMRLGNYSEVSPLPVLCSVCGLPIIGMFLCVVRLRISALRRKVMLKGGLPCVSISVSLVSGC